MEINENSIVSNICGVKSNIKLFELCEYLGISDEIDDVVEYLNDNEQFDIYGEWYLDNYDEIELTINLQFDDGVTEVFEKIFGEKYLMMVSTRYSYTCHNDNNHDNHCIEWISDITKGNFVESVIEDDGQVIKEVITKNHYEDEVLEINESNFLSTEEETQVKKYDDDNENYERYLDAKYCHYFIKKSEFNSDKWWLGWTCQGI
tara:strand:+ start:2098 stop:2709 length:612 start_codon:yes stop_codon:yes gene_type:complete